MNAFAGVFTSDGTVADESGESFCTSTDCLMAGIFQQKNATGVHFRVLLWGGEGSVKLPDWRIRGIDWEGGAYLSSASSLTR
jgi:hypothetical protein